MPILEAQNLRKVYGKDFSEVTALDGVSFTVEKGEMVAIMGGSGSGKSTLMQILAGIDRPTSGRVIVDGADVYAQSAKELTLYRRRKVAMIYQSFHLLPQLNVRDNITLPAELDGRKITEERLAFLLNTMGIAEREFFYPDQLSGGQKQRTAIARSLAMEPSVLLADEPTGNLDSKNGAEILDYIRLCNRKFGLTVLIVTHDGKIAAKTNRILTIEDGRIVSDRPVPPEGRP